MYGEECFDLTTAERALLDAVVQPGISAWTRLDRLESLGHETTTLDGLVLAGWLELWGLSDGLHVTLTPLAAYRLRVEIDELGAQEQPTWVPASPEGLVKPIRLPRRPDHQPLLNLQPAHSTAPPEDDDVLRDEWTGNPILLFGQLIRRQVKRRLAKVKV